MIRSFPRVVILVLILASSARAEDPAAHEPCVPGVTPQVCHPCYFVWLSQPPGDERVPDFVVKEQSGGTEPVHGASMRRGTTFLFPAARSRVEPVLQERPAGHQPDQLRHALDSLLRQLFPVEYVSIRGTWIVALEASTAYHGSGTSHAASVGGYRYAPGRAGDYTGPTVGTSSYGRVGVPSSGTSLVRVPPVRSSPSRPGHQSTRPVLPAATIPAAVPVPATPAIEPARPRPAIPPVVPRLLPRPPPPPPPPRPATPSAPSESSMPWTWVLGAMVAAAMLVIAGRNYRSAVRPGEKANRNIDILGLLDPADRELASERIREVARHAAEDEDWLKAMRYRFAGLLLALESSRVLQLSGWQTNLEIVESLAPKPRVAESFWATATVFELFFFGNRRPTGSDFSMFSMLLEDCLATLRGEGGPR